jgi:hypothetical protein
MKKLIPLIFLTACSTDFDPCDCERITDATTFQIERPNGIEYRTVITTINDCDSTQTQLTHHHTRNRLLIPKVGSCFK